MDGMEVNDGNRHGRQQAMATDYTITAITQADIRRPDGTFEPAYDYHYTTNTDPPVSGTVTVAKAGMSDPGAHADEVHAAIMREVAAHRAVLGG